MHEIGVREAVQIAGFTFNSQTLVMTWLTMVVVLFIGWLAARKLSIVPTSNWQVALEMIIETLHEQAEENMGPRVRGFLSMFIVSLFLFILISNWIGLIPTMASPTNDLNTTLGLALLVIAMTHVLGLYVKGGHYIGHFFQPFVPFVVINIVEELAKPITLSFRLFGNILAGEILIHILLLMLGNYSTVPSVVWIAFSVFVGGVQAFIFTMLSIAYIGSAVKTEGH